MSNDGTRRAGTHPDRSGRSKLKALRTQSASHGLRFQEPGWDISIFDLCCLGQIAIMGRHRVILHARSTVR